MAELNVNPGDLLRFADAYSELAARAAQISPQAAAELQRIAATHGPMGYPTAVGIAAGLAKADGPLQAKVADFTTYSQRFTEHTATYTKTDKDGADALDNKFVPVDSKDQSNNPDLPKPAIDPRNPFVGDERMGRWEDIVPPPYVGATPPPPWTGHRKFPNPYLEGGPSGFYSPGGKTWADESSAPAAHVENQYNFRISGEDWTSYTRTDPVTGHQQQWVQYTYEAEKWTRVPVNLNVWGPKPPNEITGELGGVNTGSLAAISPPAYRGPWEPMTLPQIATLSAANPSVHFYMPDDCGSQFTFVNGVATGGNSGLGPIMPSMIAGP